MLVVPTKKFPLLSILALSVPHAEKPNTLSVGWNKPVSLSPTWIPGAAAVPSPVLTVPAKAALPVVWLSVTASITPS